MYFPLFGKGGRLCWEPNPRYERRPLVECDAHAYPQLGIETGVPIYEQYARDRSRFDFVARPQLASVVRSDWEVEPGLA